MFKPPFNWFNKFGTLPATYKEAMSYEEQIMWLCKEVQRNESYAEEFQAVIDQINDSIGSINSDIDDVYRNLNDLATNKQNNLTAGNGILLQNSTISTAPTNISHLLEANGYIDFSNVSVTDVLDLTPVSASNSNYLILEANQGEKIEFIGKLDVAILDSNNQVLFLEKNVEASSFGTAVVEIQYNDRKVVASFYDTNTNPPDVRLFMTSDYIYDEFQRKQDNLTAGSGISINNNVISATGSANNYIDISGFLIQNQYIDFTNKTIGDTVSLEPVSANNTSYFEKAVVLGEQFKIVGSYILAEIDSNNVIVNKESGTATLQNPYIYTCEANLPSNARFVITFENTNTNQPSISDNIDQYYVYNNIETSKMIRKLHEDLRLIDSSPDTGLINGLYFNEDYHIYVNGTKNDRYDKALFLVDGSVIYAIASPVNNHSNQAYSELYYNYSNNTWNEGAFGISTDWSLIANRPSINNFTQDLNLVDGTGTTGLANGLYYTGNYHVIVNGVVDTYCDKALILADGNDSLYVIASPVNNHGTSSYYQVYYSGVRGIWDYGVMRQKTRWDLIDNKPAGMENYSTTEQVVGTWIDNKPLYQKVITGTCPAYSTSTITTDIDIASDVDFAFIENQFVVSSTGSCFPLPREKYYINDVGEEAVDNSTTGSIYGTTKKYRLKQNSTNVNGYTYYAVIRYTKTTD